MSTTSAVVRMRCRIGKSSDSAAVLVAEAFAAGAPIGSGTATVLGAFTAGGTMGAGAETEPEAARIGTVLFTVRGVGTGPVHVAGLLLGIAGLSDAEVDFGLVSTTELSGLRRVGIV